MRFAIFKIVVACALAGDAVTAFAGEFRQVSGINAQGVVILPAFAKKKEALGYVYSRFWTPTDRDIQDLELRLPKYLQDEAKRRSHDFDKNDPIEVRQNLKTSGRQYVGVFWRDRKVIYVNGFPLNGDLDWKRHFVEVADGGSAFWRIMYDVERQAFDELSINGVAEIERLTGRCYEPLAGLILRPEL